MWLSVGFTSFFFKNKRNAQFEWKKVCSINWWLIKNLANRENRVIFLRKKKLQSSTGLYTYERATKRRTYVYKSNNKEKKWIGFFVIIYSKKIKIILLLLWSSICNFLRFLKLIQRIAMYSLDTIMYLLIGIKKKQKMLKKLVANKKSPFVRTLLIGS